MSLKTVELRTSIFLGNKADSLARLVNTKLSSKPYVDILIKYLGRLKKNETDMVVRALTEKGNKKATSALLKLFRNQQDIELWAVGNALYTIDDKSSYPEILKICQNKSFGRARQMLMGTLARMKSEEAYKVLIECLSDETVKGHAIQALGRFGNPEAIEILEKIDVRKDKYEFKAKNTAIGH